ncbi:MAG: hypothetical protein KatS3mg108_1549 [Isosphaeraceae bacterium]|jgi:hypothetical protein|nr:MAG: hypothetical protein KatS3mg108_1549 [Isosphaeraceae bacterium]
MLAWFLATLALASVAAILILAALGFQQLTAQLRRLTEAVERLAASNLAQLRTLGEPAGSAEPAAPASPPPRELSVDELQARLLAAQEAGDVDGLLAWYDQLAPRLDAAQRGPLDARLLRWFLDRLMRRMRSGTVGVDVAVLAARVAERFPTTKEGAALRASLPTLRRSAGLCAECARPYNGDDDACPDCMARRADPEPATLPLFTARTDDEPAAASPSFPP